MGRVLRLFERFIVMALLGMMVLVVLLATIEVAVVFVLQLLKPPFFLLDLNNLLEMFGFFLMVVIGLELIETIRTFLEKDRLHIEVVFLVAMVAVARKVIIVDYKTVTPQILYGISAVIVALGLSYYLVRRALYMKTRPADRMPLDRSAGQ